MPRQQLSRSDKGQNTNRPSRPNRTSSSGSGSGGSGNSGAKKKKTKKITGKRVFWTLFAVTALGIFCALAGYLFIMVSGEKIYQANINKLAVTEPTKVYDRNGTLILQRSIRTGDPVKYEEIPKEVINAFVATEDRRFFDHQGVDLWSIGRAAVRDVVARSAVEGGSTITQQLAKNVFLTNDKTFFRKATEVSIALAIERNMTKEQIITTYLNRIYFGSGAYGIKEASETYFGVSDLSKLKTWQIATLAGLPKAPSRYSPQSNPELSQERRGVVLQLMQQQGYITAAEEKEAEDVTYNYKSPESKNTKFQAFIDYAMQEAEDETGLSADDLNRGGYNIYTTMDSKAQQTLEDAFKNDDLFEKSADNVKVQGSMVIVNNDTGGLVALLGGRDYVSGNFSRVTSHRQPGSSFKPIITYAPALQSGNYHSNSMLSNEKQCFGTYCPNNLHGGYSNTISMTAAMEDSVNIPAVWLLNQIGIDTGINYAKSVGFDLTGDDRNLAIALGGLSKGTNTLEMAQAYRVFADGGNYTPAYAVKSITDSTGDEVYKNSAKSTEVLSKDATDEMTQMLQNVVQNGTGKRAQINRPVAGKTGTTQHGISGLSSSANRDIWFAGYTKEWTAAVWMGYDKPDRTHLLKDGSGRAAALFAAVMGPALEGYPVQNFDTASVPPPVVEEPEEEEQPVTPSAVTGLSASFDQDSQSVALAWNPVEGASSYTVYRKESGATQFSAISSGGADPVASDGAVTAGQTYDYYVTATTADGSQSDASNTVQVTIDQAQTEQPPAENPDGVVPPEGETPTPPTGEETPGTDTGPGAGDGTGGTGDTGNNTGPTDGSTNNGGTTPPDNGQNGTDGSGTTDGTTTPGTTNPNPGNNTPPAGPGDAGTNNTDNPTATPPGT
ncbi:transglycosylase domain-containing protein [Paenibacillus kandeliae]|uniref:transglycosylase domain-containing protein n=1 Tax=Paenibacillus kandeliae TaxID=3231269 RepID=UPI00345AF655